MEAYVELKRAYETAAKNANKERMMMWKKDVGSDPIAFYCVTNCVLEQKQILR